MRAGLVLVLGAALMATGCSGNMNSSSSSSGSDSDAGQPAPSFSQFSDIPVPDGAHMDVGDTLVLGQGDNWVGRLVFDMRFTSPPSVFDFFKADMPNYKWQEISSVRSDISVMTYRRGNRVATIQIEDENLGLGSEVVITVGPANTSNPAPMSDQSESAQPPMAQPVPPAQPVTEQPLK